MRPEISFLVSVSRGMALSGLLIIILPAAAGADALWLAMPVTELLVSAAVAYYMIRCTQNLYSKESRHNKAPRS